MITALTGLEAILVAALPAITAIGAIITVAVKIISALNSLKDNEEIKAERDALKEQNKALLKECKKQREQSALLIQKVTKVIYKDLTEVKENGDLLEND